MERDLRWNGERPQKNGKKTSDGMEKDLRRMERRPQMEWRKTSDGMDKDTLMEWRKTRDGMGKTSNSRWKDRTGEGCISRIVYYSLIHFSCYGFSFVFIELLYTNIVFKIFYLRECFKMIKKVV
ncbi:hypothetical protein SNE40_022275 [Patella caerulea]|uniref:Uncharacterized protein n=1 Tax=Patella caerulea TaxID=87958 RepID=A0AAN8GAK6_PATCE